MKLPIQFFPPDSFSCALSKRATSAARILIVDDDATTRLLMAQVLESTGYKVDQAEDGEDAWLALCKNPYHLLVTDHDMPRLTGLGLVERVRLAGCDLPAVLVSGSVDLGGVVDYPQLRLAAILPKPVVFSALLQVLNRIRSASPCTALAGTRPGPFGGTVGSSVNLEDPLPAGAVRSTPRRATTPVIA